MSDEVQTPTAGGRATAAGMSYQSRVAAYYAVAILTERNAEPPLHLPADATLEYVRCETAEPVDDVLIGLSTGGHIFGQAKRTLGLSPGESSPLHSVADQFVRQYLSNRDQKHPVPPWTAPLDPKKDRLVAIVGPRSPDTVKTALANVLDSVRELTPTQPLVEAASNASERAALSTFIDHLSSSWMAATGATPPDAEIRLIASLSYISLLAVEEDESNEQQAKERLRNSVLTNPTHAPAAWDCLVQYAAGLAKTGGGADRPALQQVLIEAGFDLQTPRSYRDDVLRLTDATTSALELISGLANITVGHKTVHLARACSDYLSTVALEGSLLVVGEPGAGKSGCLYDVCATARQNGTDVVLLLVDRLASSADPFKDELGITRPLADVLRSWPGKGPALLVLDALDAARDERVSRKIRDVITAVRVPSDTRWRVIASIRKFDLRYGDELRRLFRSDGIPATEYQDRDFRYVAHMDVPPLTGDELKALCAASPELDALWNAANEEFRELLKVPFNMRLAADLVGDGVAVNTLGLVRTQLDLLDRYWTARVLGDDQRGEDRERVLREVCELLVSETLQADRARLTSSGKGLVELLSRNVLAEWRASPAAQANRYRVGFSHHVLFDYAVSRLLMRGSPESLLARLRHTPDFLLVARPSLSLHFRHLWTTDRPAFWDLTLRLISDKQVPRIAGLIGPGVAADSARELADLGPLAEALKTPARLEVATEALRHIVGSLVILKIDVAGPGAGPWCQFAHDIAEGIPPSAVGSLRVLIATAADSSVTLTASQSTSLNNASRLLLQYAWTSEPANHFLAGIALQAICRTFSGDPSESAAVLRKAVETSHLAECGYGELPWIARELQPLMTLDPKLVSDIYCAAFSYEDTSQAPTQLGGGRIVSLSSRRNQDYKQAWWQLAHDMATFLSAAPAEATRAVLVALHEYLRREKDLDRFGSDSTDDAFTIRGQSVLYQRDHSAIWDADSTRVHDEPVMMLGEWDQFLRELSSDQESGRFDTVVSAILRGPHSAVIWRRLLQAARESGGHLAALAKDLCVAGPVLGGLDTSHPAGELLSARFHEYSSPDREAIERAILGLRRESAEDERAEKIRARLLGCLPEADIVTEEARTLLGTLRTTDAVPKNEPPFQFTSMTGGPLTTDDWLAHLGVPVSDPPNRRLIDMTAPVKDFGRASQPPTQEDVIAILPHLATLRAALSLAGPEGAHSEAVNAAWGYIAGACSRAAKMEGVSSNVEPGLTLQTLLLEASTTARPQFDPEVEAQFDRTASWGSPAARIDAAAGLLTLARTDLTPSDQLLASIRRLSADSVSAVRYQVAVHILYLFQHCPAFVWELITEGLERESSQTVLKAWIHSVARLSSSDAKHVALLLINALGRTDQNPISRDSRDAAILVVMQLFVFRNHVGAGKWIRHTLDHLVDVPADARALVPFLHEGLIYGSDEPEDNRIRRRAIDLATELVHRSISGLHSIEEQQRASGTQDSLEDAQRSAETLAAISSNVTGQVHIATGTFALTHPQQAPKREGPSPEVRRRFYSEASSLLDELPQIGLVPAAHQMVEILATFVAQDPKGVFLRIVTAVRAGSRRGYASESLAADLVVRIVKLYLADYRGLLRDDERCRALLIEVLDLFIDAGWPSARELTYKLEEIFR